MHGKISIEQARKNARRNANYFQDMILAIVRAGGSEDEIDKALVGLGCMRTYMTLLDQVR